MQPKPSVPAKSRDELSVELQAAYDRAMAVRGDGTFIGVMAHAPKVFDWYADFYQRIFYGGKVAVRYKEIARYRLSTLHGCAFCNKGNRLDAAAAGLTDDQLLAIDDPTASCWDASDRAVIKLAMEMSLSRADGTLSETLYAELRHQFDDEEIVELGVTMGVLCGMAKFLFTFDLVERESYCEFGSNLTQQARAPAQP